MRTVKNQHGDVLLLSIDALPDGAKKLDIKNGWVLEKGEGVHTHVFEDISGIEVYEKDGETYVCVSKSTKINHEEHGEQTVMPGTYKKKIERVWDYESEEARKVID